MRKSRINPVADPVLKNRLIIANDPQFSIKKWGMMIVTMAIIIGVFLLGYSFPHFFDVFIGSDQPTKEASTAPGTNTVVTTLSTPLPISATIASPQSSATTAVKSSSLPATVPTAPPRSPKPVLDSNLVPTSAGTPISTTAPPSTALSSKPEIAVVTPAPIAPTSSASTPVVSTPEVQPKAILTAEISPPKITNYSVSDLLARAQEQLSKQRFTSPKGDNAYETYQALAKLDTDKANSLLDMVVNWYVEQGQEFIKKGKITQPKNTNAYEMYQKLKEMAPTHPQTEQLWEAILAKLKELTTQKVLPDKFTQANLNNAYALYQQLVTVAPNSPETQLFLNNIISQLLTQAEQQIADKKWATPKNDNAVDTYQKILKLAPANPQAKAGLDQVADKYYEIAVGHQKRGKDSSSLMMIKRGLEISPAHVELLKLKSEVGDKFK